MTTGTLGSDTALTLRAVEDAPRRALAVLLDPEIPLLDAVVWLSAHLSAVEHVLYPELRREKASSDAALLAHARGIERLLRALEQQLTGDAFAAHVDQKLLVQSLAYRLVEYIEQQRRLLDLLRSRLPDETQRDIAAAYLRSLELGPTRPHPHAPHGRVLSRLAYRINGPRDRLLDTLDSRHVPTPHRSRAPVKTSLWGDYLLGTSHPGVGRDDR